MVSVFWIQAISGQAGRNDAKVAISRKLFSGINADTNTNDSFHVERFRIKIWEELDGVETVIYDNALGSDEDLATTEIGGGSIKIHKQEK